MNLFCDIAQYYASQIPKYHAWIQSRNVRLCFFVLVHKINITFADNVMCQYIFTYIFNICSYLCIIIHLTFADTVCRWYGLCLCCADNVCMWYGLWLCCADNVCMWYGLWLCCDDNMCMWYGLWLCCDDTVYMWYGLCLCCDDTVYMWYGLWLCCYVRVWTFATITNSFTDLFIYNRRYVMLKGMLII